MTRNERFDRTVSDWLDDEAGHRVPDYLGEVLARTTRTRQRPAWSSLERWLPMQTTLRLAPVPRIAWLLVVARASSLALGAAALVDRLAPRDSRRRSGSARNGAILYGATTATSTRSIRSAAHRRPLIAGLDERQSRRCSRRTGPGSLFLRDAQSTRPSTG